MPSAFALRVRAVLVSRAQFQMEKSLHSMMKGGRVLVFYNIFVLKGSALCISYSISRLRRSRSHRVGVDPTSELLRALIRPRTPLIRLAEQFEASAAEMIAVVREHKLEGVVAKHRVAATKPAGAADRGVRFVVS